MRHHKRLNDHDYVLALFQLDSQTNNSTKCPWHHQLVR